jgi:hypothetical protein
MKIGSDPLLVPNPYHDVIDITSIKLLGDSVVSIIG